MQEIDTILSNAEEPDVQYSEHIQLLNHLPLFIEPFLSDEEDEEDPLRENDVAAEVDSGTLGVPLQEDPPGIEPHAKPLIDKRHGCHVLLSTLDAVHEKLKVAVWISLHTVVLPFAMAKLLDSEKQLVGNWLHLASAVSVVAEYETSYTRTNEFITSMQKYIETLARLSPSTAITPNLYYSFHIPHLLNVSVAAMLSCWRPEQFNGHLQRTPTNKKLWELDRTLLLALCQMGNLLATVAASEAIAAFKQISEFLPDSVTANLLDDDPHLQSQYK
ncbi:MAG: hypothetical protein CYPHOPRED_003185 [Cyphobasidiales sp. Tagirdzhanova-0007]|nr:MAG: hypothetical protein CYPHOPRED_003185 [Cyphobasidiales sp. Tagirdzhanova-0007]